MHLARQMPHRVVRLFHEQEKPVAWRERLFHFVVQAAEVVRARVKLVTYNLGLVRRQSSQVIPMVLPSFRGGTYVRRLGDGYCRTARPRCKVRFAQRGCKVLFPSAEPKGVPGPALSVWIDEFQWPPRH